MARTIRPVGSTYEVTAEVDVAPGLEGEAYADCESYSDRLPSGSCAFEDAPGTTFVLDQAVSPNGGLNRAYWACVGTNAGAASAKLRATAFCKVY